MRRIDLNFLALKLPLDFVALLGAAITAYALRFSKWATDIRPILTNVPYSQYLLTAASIALIWIVLFAMAGLYSIRPRRAVSEFGRIVLASTAGIMVVIAIVFFRREVTTSRFIVIAVWALAIAYVWFGRLILRLVRYAMLRAKIGHQRIAIIGHGKTADELVKMYRARPALGYTVAKVIKEWDETARHDLETLARNGKVHAILLADPDASKEDSLDIIALAEENHLTFRYLADLFAARFSRIELSAVGGIPVIEVKRTPLDGWGRIAKRAFDMVVSAVLIVIFSPLMLVVTILIKLTSPGRVLFSRLPDGSRTQRVGEGGKPFHYFKFRSMYKDVHWERYGELAKMNLRKGDPLVKIKNDPRVTPIGRFIRKWSMDELPELFLVFLGRMSLVGPRPHLPEEVENYKPQHRQVLAIKPGITGMAQISGRSDLSFDDEVQLDTWYIKNWSLWRDLWILLKTPWVVITHRGVEEGA